MTNRTDLIDFLRSPEVNLPGWAESQEHLAGAERIVEALRAKSAWRMKLWRK